MCLIYSSWWITCRSPVDAPYNDLSLYQNLLKYAAVNSEIAGSAVRALKRHLWYLCPEMITLAIFSDIVPKSKLQHLADKLVSVKPPDELKLPQDRYGTGFGKPKFPDTISETTRLGDLVTGDSWFIVQLLEMNMDFLDDDVDNWPGHPSFLISKKMTCLNVVNDSAERNVKLSSDFLIVPSSEEYYQNILQVVESARKETPNLRKRKRPSLDIRDNDNN